MTVRFVVPTRVEGSAPVPPSKSYTHRAAVCAYFSGGRSTVERPLESGDTRATFEGLRVLGAETVRSSTTWSFERVRPLRSARHRAVDCRESGTTARFLVAAAAQLSCPVRFDCANSLRCRPMEPLYRALERGGTSVRRVGRPGWSLPVVVTGPVGPIRATVSARESSQFVSALLMALPLCAGDSTLRFSGRPVSRPYLEATCAMLRAFGVRIDVQRDGFRVPGDQTYRPTHVRVPADASSAAYLLVAAALTGGRVRLRGISSGWPQADLQLLPILRRMGVEVRQSDGVVSVAGPIRRTFDEDLTDAPDLVPLLGVAAACTPGRSRLRGAPHLIHKESDRRAGTISLAHAFGARVRSRAGELVITGTDAPRPVRLEGLADHRLVMSAAVGALAAHGISRIGTAESVAKSFPGFWDALARLGAPVGVAR